MKRIAIILVLCFGFSSSIQATPERNEIDLFDMSQGKPVWSTSNSESV